jgi:hypothetical protein
VSSGGSGHKLLQAMSNLIRMLTCITRFFALLHRKLFTKALKNLFSSASRTFAVRHNLNTWRNKFKLKYIEARRNKKAFTCSKSDVGFLEDEDFLFSEFRRRYS